MAAVWALIYPVADPRQGFFGCANVLSCMIYYSMKVVSLLPDSMSVISYVSWCFLNDTERGKWEMEKKYFTRDKGKKLLSLSSVLGSQFILTSFPELLVLTQIFYGSGYSANPGAFFPLAGQKLDLDVVSSEVAFVVCAFANIPKKWLPASVSWSIPCWIFFWEFDNWAIYVGLYNPFLDWLICVVKDTSLNSLFWMGISSFPSVLCWRKHLPSIVGSLHLFW